MNFRLGEPIGLGHSFGKRYNQNKTKLRRTSAQNICIYPGPTTYNLFSCLIYVVLICIAMFCFKYRTSTISIDNDYKKVCGVGDKV